MSAIHEADDIVYARTPSFRLVLRFRYHLREASVSPVLISSIITGYTLWNAEYRVSLKRNYDITTDPRKEEEDQYSKDNVRFGSQKGVSEDLGNCVEELEGMSPQVFGDFSPEALSYIQHLQSELSTMKEELDSQKKKALHVECEKGNHNDLLEYLRSLDPEMVTELSQLSSPPGITSQSSFSGACFWDII